MQRYRATKISGSPESIAKTAETIKEYRKSLFDADVFSPPVDYYVEGTIISFPKVGDVFMMNRDNRNGVLVAGLFITSMIESIEEFNELYIFTTRNSIYKLEKLDN